LGPQSDGQEAKLTCQTQNAQIKVDVNTTIRGNLLPPRMMDVADTVEAEDVLNTIVLKRKGYYVVTDKKNKHYGWLTDIHLEFLAKKRGACFCSAS
jgi:hypothetical protein